MAVHVCTCGARYRIPDSAVGKRARCKHCGAELTLTGGDSSEARAPGPRAGARGSDEAARGPRPGNPPPHDLVRYPVARDGDTVHPRRGFAASVGWSFLFVIAPSDLASFLAIWVAFTVAPFLGCIPYVGMIVSIALRGWYAAFLLEVIASAGNGEEELPSLPLFDNAWDDIVFPIFQWTGSWVLVMIPAVVYAGVTSLIGTGGFVRMLSGGLAGLTLPGGNVTVLALLICGGLFFWPIVVLCIAFGGLGAIARVDRIALTVVRTLPAYSAVVALVLGTYWAEVELGSLIASGPAFRGTATPTIGLALAFTTLLGGVSIYCDIVTARIVGLYYHHFKHRFAWSWG